ncbi:aspartyl protease family protein [Maricaulis sp. CAU 1757]
MAGRMLAAGLAAWLGAASPALAAQPLPLDYDRDGRPLVAVELTGGEAYDFVLDTAAQHTVLGEGLVTDLALSPDPDSRARMQGASGVIEVPMYRLQRLAVGEKVIEDGLYLSVPPTAHADGPPHDGILGQDVFAHGRLAFDFEAGTVDLDAPDGDAEALSLEARRMLGGFFLVDVTVDGVATSALVDTGASESFANDALRDALEPFDTPLTAATERRGISQHPMTLWQGHAAVVDLGGVSVPATAIDFTASPVFATFSLSDRPALVLGMDVLRQLGGLVIDYEAGTVSVRGAGG